MTGITLREVDRNNWRSALTLKVQPAQQRFVSEVIPVAAIALAKAYVRPQGMIWLPYAIYADEEMIGFFELAYPPETHDTCWMFHFFIDQSHQGKGYGKQALKAFIQLVRQDHPTCPKINLTVHAENVVAQRLYTQAGFQATGNILYDEPVYNLTLL